MSVELWGYVLKVAIALIITISLLYFLLPIIIKRGIKTRRGKNVEIEEVLPLGKEIFFVSLRIKDKRIFLIFSPYFAKVLYEESIDDNTS
ncbi:MAG: hypothetical protein DSY42_04085 [Aquifex sp.]|nr:MAG: hypothetical protein DSY42_04085 [Aquifex sp.]